jgi:hypothetical protein
MVQRGEKTLYRVDTGAWCTQMRTMTDVLNDAQGAAGNHAVQVLANRHGRKQIVV